MFLLLTIKSVIFFKKYPSFLQIKVKKKPRSLWKTIPTGSGVTGNLKSYRTGTFRYLLLMSFARTRSIPPLLLPADR